MSFQQVIDQIKHFAGLAVHFDRQGNIDAATYYYMETSFLIDSAPDQEELKIFRGKAAEYKKRAEELLLASKKANESSIGGKAKVANDLERAHFLMGEGLDDDEAGKYEDAVEHYKEAVELCIKAKNTTEDRDLQKRLAKLATEALDRAETIKGIHSDLVTGKTEVKPEDVLKAQVIQKDIPQIKFDYLNLRDDNSTPNLSVNNSASGYSDEEKKVLAETSMINGREYVPFMSVDLKERFAFPVPYSDKHGKLQLSKKQSSKLSRWARPDEFITNPKVLEIVDCFSVKQTVVSDCSFVASIAISAQYEKKFGKKIITKLIYPQNRKGEPVYNPCGKYMVVLRINGVPRKVVLDDYFPLGIHTEMLCSYSSNKSELWISLLEKAYMKVMGGYDFPGSNSNIDLYALTGWIPERVSIKQKEDAGFKKDEVFRKIFQRFHKGDVLVTLATGEMSEAEADRAGLVPTHAYAMLDIREVNGIRLFLLKNPWAHLRWKGNYSEMDLRNWTPNMMKALNYDPKNAQNFDNGVFWIDYDSLCRFFDVFYMNWNPDLFKYTYAVHHLWKAGRGPAKDMYNISANPQYSLEIEKGSGAIWVLLSRHITEIDDFKDNKEYITLLVYKKDGKRVYYPYGPDPFIDGVRINSPHYLCKIEVNDQTPRRLTLVVSQYEKSTTIYYTCRVYSTLPFHLKRIQDPYKSKQEITGSWKGKTAGGCGNYRDTYPNNPRYQFAVDHETQLLIELKGPKQFQIGFDLVCVFINSELKTSSKYFKVKPSGPYRTGYVMMTADLLVGTYDIVPTTFRPGQEGPFFLTISSPRGTKAQKVQ